MSSIGISRKLFFQLSILVILILIPLMGLSAYIIHMLILVFFYAYVATSWNILGGHCGQKSLGHAAFVGLGCYFTYFMSYSWFALSPWVSMIIGGLVAAFFAALVLYPAFRFGQKAIFFILTSVCISEILYYFFVWWRPVTGGSLGLFVPHKSEALYYFQFAEKWPYYYFILALWLASLIITSKLGRLMYQFNAVREDEVAAESLGIPVRRCKMIAAIISAFLCGIGGGFFLHFNHIVTPMMAFGFTLSLKIFVASLFGGSYNIIGPTLGAVILTITSEYLRVSLGGTYAGADLLIYGALMIIVIRFLPRGISPFMTKLLRYMHIEEERK